MKKVLFVLMVLGAMVMTGCAAKQVPEYSSSETTYVEPVMPFEVKSRIDEANRVLDAGDHQEALRLYDEVLAEYSSDDAEFSCAVRTNQAMAGLAMDRDSFLHYGGMAREACQGVKHPSNNTRFVLAVHQGFVNDRSRDVRIPKGLHESVFRTLRGGEGG